MNLGSEPNPDSGDVGKLLKALGLFYPSYLNLELCPCGVEVDTALCEACHIWKDRTFVWVSPGDLGDTIEPVKKLLLRWGRGTFSRQMEFKLLNSTLEEQ